MKYQLILFVIILFQSCLFSDDDGYHAKPKEFSCIVNNKLWIPDGKPLDQILHVAVIPTDPESLIIQARKNSTSEGITIGIVEFTGEGEYLISDTSNNAQIIFLLEDCYYSNSDNTFRNGVVSFSNYNSELKQLTGSFEVQLLTQVCDTLYVTDGNFNLAW